MGVKWYEKASGDISMMRIGAMVAVVMGCFMIVSGVGLAVAMLVTKRYDLASFATVLVSTGPGMISLSLGAKALQATKGA